MACVGHVAYKSLWQWHRLIQPDACLGQSKVILSVLLLIIPKLSALFRTGAAANDNLTPSLLKNGAALHCTLDALYVLHEQNPKSFDIQVLRCKIALFSGSSKTP